MCVVKSSYLHICTYDFANGRAVPNSAFEQHVSRGNSGVDSASHVQTSHTERPARDLPSGETHHPGERPSKSDHESEVDTDDQTLEEENAELKERVKELWAALGLFKADRLTERLLEMKEKLSTARTERDEAVEQVERLKIKLKRRTEIAVDKVNELQAQVEASAAEVALLRSASGNHVPLTRSAIKTQEMITTAAEVGWFSMRRAFDHVAWRMALFFGEFVQRAVVGFVPAYSVTNYMRCTLVN